MAIDRNKKGKRARAKVTSIFRAWLGGFWRPGSEGAPGSDVIAPAEFGFAIEVKDHEILRVRHFFKPTNVLTKFWDQTIKQAEKERLKPLLVVNVEDVWYCIALFGTVKKDAGRPVLTSRFDEHLVEIRTIDDFMLSYEDSFEALFKKKAAKKVA